MFKITLRFTMALVCVLFWNFSSAGEPVKRFAVRPEINGQVVKHNGSSTLNSQHRSSALVGAVLNGPVLYDQLLPLSFGSIVSHEMTDPANVAMTSFAADDFIVPEGNSWDVSYVNVAGTYTGFTGSSVQSFNIAFYADDNGMPGTELFAFNNVVSFNEISIDPAMAVFLYEISLPQSVNLTAGNYWLGVQAVSDYTVTSQWNWVTHESLIIESEFHWKNPADGFGLGYIDWTPASTITWGSYNLAFSLSGPGLPGDLSAKAVTAPVNASGLTANEHITMQIKNEGAQNITGVTMAYRINGAAAVSENASSLTIAPNQYATYTFNTTANLSQPGPYEIEAYTANPSDPQHSNDTTFAVIYNLGAVYPMVATGTQTITTCGATFTDAGGLEGNIGMNDDAVTTIYPANAGDRVRLTFLEFNASFGGFEVYNGTDVNAPLIGNFTGTIIPTEITAMNASGALTIHFMGPGWEETSGWVAYISCVTPLPDEFEMNAFTGSLLTVFEGNTMTITSTVRNIGTSAIDKPVTFTVNGTTISEVNTGVLEPYQSTEVSTVWTAPSPGNYIFEACLPADGNNSNNCLQMERDVLAFNAFFEDFENEPFPPSNWYHGGLWARSNMGPAAGLYHATSSFSNLQSDTLVSCRVDVAENPVLNFYARTSLWWKGNLDLWFYNEQTSSWNFVMNVPLNPMTYGLITADLSAFAGTTGRVGFFVNVTDPFSWSGKVDLDLITGHNITVHTDNMDLKTVSLAGSNYYYAGVPSVFNLTIKNNGLLPVDAGDYNVTLFASNNTPIISVPGNAIEPGAEQSYELSHTFTELSNMEVYARIVFEQDQYQTNNISNSIFTTGLADSSEIVIVGNTETYQDAPLIFGFRNSLSETLYTGEEIGTEGVIFGVRYSFNFDGNETGIPVKIWMGTTAQADLMEWVPAGQMTQVFEGNIDFVKEAGSVYIPFQTPFNYSDSSQNLVVMVQKIDDHISNNRFFRSYGTSITSTLSAVSNTDVPDAFAPPAAGQSNINPNMELVFNHNLGTASGNVHNSINQPLADVMIYVQPLNITTFTNSSGNYTLPYVPAGDFATKAEKFGYEVVIQTLSVDFNENTVLDYELPDLAMVTVSGNVVGSDDPATGIANAHVSINGYSSYAAFTNSSGDFIIDSVYVADSYLLTVNAERFETYNQTIDVHNDTVLGTIILTEALEISRVVNAQSDSVQVELVWFAPSTIAEGVVATDDGIHENGFAGEPGEKVWLGNLMQFEEAMTVISFDLFWAKYGTSQPNIHRLSIFDVDGNHIYTTPEFSSVTDGWVSVDIPDLTLGGKFYVMALYDNTASQANYLAMDTASATTPDNAFYHYEGGYFYPLSAITFYYGSFIIHANVKYGDTNMNPVADNTGSRAVTGYMVTTGKLNDIDNASNWPFISNMLSTTSYTDGNWPPAEASDYIYGVKTFYTTGESELSFSNILHYDPVNTGGEDLVKLMVWPNPASQFIFVNATSHSEVSLLNMQGNQVRKGLFNGNLFIMDVKDLASGTYLVLARIGNNMVTQKVVVK